MNLQALLPRSLLARSGAESVITRFWHWWSAEILYFVPAGLRAAFDKQERLLLVSVRDSDLIIEYRHGSAREQLQTISLLDKPETAANAIQANTQAAISDSDVVIVELSAARAARRQVSLPFGTEDRIAEVLGYEMDRLTPFASKDTYFHYHTVNRDMSRRVINIELVIALRQTVDDVLNRLEKNGIKATQLTVAGAVDTRTNLLPSDKRVSAVSTLPRVPAALTALAVILAMVAIAFPLLHQRSELAQLDEEISQLKPAAIAADQIRTQIAETARQSGFFNDKWADTPTKISMLNEIARIVPDDTWLSRVQINGMTVRIQGESDDASSLIGLVEASALLRDARFSSPVTKNPRTSNDRFVIEMSIDTEGAD